LITLIRITGNACVVFAFATVASIVMYAFVRFRLRQEGADECRQLEEKATKPKECASSTDSDTMLSDESLLRKEADDREADAIFSTDCLKDA
jgi:hypothetical protein